LTTIQRLKVDGHCSLPSFDHALKDPCEDDIEVSFPSDVVDPIQILPNHKIILAEGIYLLLSPTDQPPESPGYDFSAWYQVREEWDERWFMDVDIDTAMNR
jgi:pantothenate kinase